MSSILTYALFTPNVRLSPIAAGKVADALNASPRARGDPGERPREREEAGRPLDRPGRPPVGRVGPSAARPAAGASGGGPRFARRPASRRPAAGQARRALRPPLERSFLDRPVRARFRHLDRRARGAGGSGRALGSPGRGRVGRGSGAPPLGASPPRQGIARRRGDVARGRLSSRRRGLRPLRPRRPLSSRRRLAPPRTRGRGAGLVSPSPDSLPHERHRRQRRPDRRRLPLPLARRGRNPPPLNRPHIPPDPPEKRPPDPRRRQRAPPIPLPPSPTQGAPPVIAEEASHPPSTPT